MTILRLTWMHREQITCMLRMPFASTMYACANVVMHLGVFLQRGEQIFMHEFSIHFDHTHPRVYAYFSCIYQSMYDFNMRVLQKLTTCHILLHNLPNMSFIGHTKCKCI